MDRATANSGNKQAFLISKSNQTRNLMAEHQSSDSQKRSIALNKIKALKCIAEGFVKYFCAEFQSKIETENIMKVMGQNLNVQNVDFSVLLGLAIKEEVLNNKNFVDFSTEIRQIVKSKSLFEQDSDDDLTIEFDLKEAESGSSKFSKIRSQRSQPDNFYAKYSEVSDFQTEPTVNQSRNIDIDNENEVNLTMQIDEQNYNDDFIQNQNKEVMEYLYKISQPTTELTYLCQKMKWLQPDFQEGLSKLNDKLFSCVAQVHVSSKNHNTFCIEGECRSAVSKKQAKRVASLFILRKIYNRLNDVWMKFKKEREENPSMQQVLNANNQQIFKKAHFNLVHGSIFNEEEKNSEPVNQHTHKINQYLDDIKSHKAELNILQGRYNKKITQVEFERDKQNSLNMWPVKAMIYADNQLLEADALQSSKKVAEQKCCRKLLFKIYNKDTKRWQQFKAYKESKGLN